MANKVRVDIKKELIMARIRGKWTAGLYWLASAIRADANRFVRVDKGTLRASSYTASDLSKGKIVWHTPYARRVYYTGKPVTIINPQAARLWCEKAKAKYQKDWDLAASRMLGAGVNGK